MTLEEYLEFEEQSPIRHEYVAGEVFAMTGATTRHNLITMNLTQLLRPAGKRRGCRVFAIDVKLRAGPDRIYYPDLLVACGRAAEVDLIVDAPTLVVEVTSPSTRATDRREKLDAYLRLPSLQCYLVVEQRRRQVIAYARDGGEWRKDEFHGTGEIPVAALGVTLTLDEIYDDVPLPPLRVGEVEEEEDDDEWDDEEELR